jgi:alpha-glucosidase
LNADLVRGTMLDWPGGQDEGWPSWAFSNHDSSRAEQRWAKDRFTEDYAKFALMLLMSLRGNVFLYQGEELGLSQADIPFEKLQDPEAITNWPETLGRDGARTPIPWRENEAFAGFSEAEPWLPIDPRHIAKAIDRQNGDPDSVLNFARRMIALRARLAPLRSGGISFLETPDNMLAFVRTTGDESVLCVFNFSLESVSWSPADAADWATAIAANMGAAPGCGNGPTPLPLSLPPESGYIATRKAASPPAS